MEKTLTILDLLNKPTTKKALEKVVPEYMTPDRMLNLAVNCLDKNPDLKQCEPETVLGAFMAAASLGLEPNTPLQQAFLIPRKRNYKENGTWKNKMECTFQIGNRGFLYLSYQSPSIFAITTNVIYRGESYKYDSGQAFLTHEPSLERETDDADFDNIIASYCAVMFSANPSVKIPIVVPRGDLIKIRESSDTYRYLRDAIAGAGNDNEKLRAEKLFADTAWVKWAKPMCMKSSIKQACKQLPLTTQMKRAAQLDDFSEIGKLDLRSIAFIKDRDELDAVVSATALPAPSESDKPLPVINLNDKKQPQPVAAKNSAQKPAAKTMDGPPAGHPAAFNQHDTGGF